MRRALGKIKIKMAKTKDFGCRDSLLRNSFGEATGLEELYLFAQSSVQCGLGIMV